MDVVESKPSSTSDHNDSVLPELAATNPRRHWETSLWEREAADEIRKGFSYRGLGPRLTAAGAEPLLLAVVHGLDEAGAEFHWVARRQRKRVAHPHACPKPLPPVDWLGALDARAHWRKLGWWIAAGYTLGSVLFVISGVAGLSYHVLHSEEGLRSPFAALIGWPNAVAANLCFFPAGLLQMVESANLDWQQRLRCWQDGGRKAPQPHHRLLPRREELSTISWWASLIQLSGMLGFNLATLASLVSTAVPMSATTLSWTVSFGFTYGGAGFTVSGVMYCLEQTGSWWRGALPSRLSDLHSISWNAVFFNLQGSIGFLIGGAAAYATSFSWQQVQWITGYGNLGGAEWFLVAALAALLEQANPQRP